MSPEPNVRVTIMPPHIPSLYTFRRCPYAIRARLAIAVSGFEVNEIEVDLKDKPPAMLALSPKGTVPVLQLPDGRVLEESLDIMRWALALHDPFDWLGVTISDRMEQGATVLIHENDNTFKRALDGYKYPTRFPEKSQTEHREAGVQFLARLEQHLSASHFLVSDTCRLVDAAVFPFVRQFAAVDRAWFDDAPLPQLRNWLVNWDASTLFAGVMRKRDNDVNPM